MSSRAYVWLLILPSVLAAVGDVTPARGQEPYRDDYLRFVPLSYPRLVRQTPASVRFHLYGDRSDPGYRDRSPRNGVDDRREVVLRRLARRFAPILIQNTTALPMDWRVFRDSAESFPLVVDTWNVAAGEATLVGADSIELADRPAPACESTPRATAGSPPVTGRSSSSRPRDDGADCRLVELLETFRPEGPGGQWFRSLTVDVDRHLFRVLWVDFPGHDESTWKKAYRDDTGNLPEPYRRAARTFVHPFVREVEVPPGAGPLTTGSHSGARVGESGYELVLQYWFFYPWNDGGNNHEGDWEHVNVTVAPRAAVTSLLDADDVRSILRGDFELFVRGGERELVIQRVEYFLHSKMMTLDFSRPNVYQPRGAWKEEVRALARHAPRRRSIWKRIRHMAYRTDAESLDAVNTHPVGYIGADNKGFDQALKAPGASNRDSHGTYPFPGMYKDVGPAGASEAISARFDHRGYFAREERVRSRGGLWTPLLGPRPAAHGTPQPYYLADESGDRIELLPDWERLIDLVREDPAVRREWSWLVLPIRWGTPAAPSPLAGIVAHAETGNLAPVGPAFNAGWNRAGRGSGYTPYEPHIVGSQFSLSVQDNYENELGFLNLTFPTLEHLPPFNLAWNVLAAPFRRALGKPRPTFYPTENLPTRLVGMSAGATVQLLPEEFGLLIFNERQLTELSRRTGDTDPGRIVAGGSSRVENATAVAGRIFFALGDRFVSENTIRHSRSDVGLAVGDGTGSLHSVGSRLAFWEYAGSLRYNLATRTVQPFLKAGYGLTWYRLEDATLDGELLAAGESPWVHRPSLTSFDNLLPNSWHLGAGVELLPRRGTSPLPGGVDLGIHLEYELSRHGLGLQAPTELVPALGSDVDVTRHSFTLAATLSY